MRSRLWKAVVIGGSVALAGCSSDRPLGVTDAGLPPDLGVVPPDLVTDWWNMIDVAIFIPPDLLIVDETTPTDVASGQDLGCFPCITPMLGDMLTR